MNIPYMESWDIQLKHGYNVGNENNEQINLHELGEACSPIAGKNKLNICSLLIIYIEVLIHNWV